MKRLSSIYVFLVILSGFFPTVIFPDAYSDSFYVYNTRGFLIIIISAFLLHYSCAQKKKTLFNIGSMLGVIGYLVWFHSTISVINILKDYEEISYSGIIAAAVSFIFLIVYYIHEIKNMKKTETNDVKEIVNELVPDNDSNDNNNDKENKYVLANYIVGLQYKNIYNNLSLIVYDEQNNKLNITIDSEEKIKKEFDLDDIIAIDYNESVIINNIPKQNTADRDLNLNVAATLFLGTPGLLISQSGLLDDINNYEKVSVNTQYDIEITCNIDGEMKKVSFRTKNNPKEFIDFINQKLNHD